MNIQTPTRYKTKAFINGVIQTVDARSTIAEAVIVSGNKIIFIGTTAEARMHCGSETEIIDLEGRLMLPGFIDNHVHFLTGGFYLSGIDLRQAKSAGEFISLIKNYVAVNQGKWITGGDWDHEAWETGELPVKEWIDEFTQATPLFVQRFDGHEALANSYVLKLAGITSLTPDPDGGMIVRDRQTGEPTGILKDNAMSLVHAVMPERSEEEYSAALKAALNHAKKNGFTSVQDITYPNDLKVYQKFERENKLTCRIDTRLPIAEYGSLITLGIQNNFGSDKLKTGALKAFADGSLGSATALFFEPYVQDSSTSGLAMDILSDGRLRKWALEADKARLQLSIHAIGDKANSMVLDIFEEVARTNPGWDRRFRIEHAQHVRPQDVARFAALGVLASVQPYHLIDDGAWADKRIGPDRLKDAYPFSSFLKAGVKLSFGSDWTVAPLDALAGIYAAVTRRTLDGRYPEGWIAEQKISVMEAVRAYCIDSAYGSFEENIKGSIEPGKLADFVVLDQDIFHIPAEEIRNTNVVMTVFDGEIIYSAEQSL